MRVIYSSVTSTVSTLPIGEVVRWGGGEGATGVAGGLVHLMKDSEPSVRTAAATAAQLLSQHAHVL